MTEKDLASYSNPFDILTANFYNSAWIMLICMDMTRESEPDRNDTAPAVNFKTGSGSTHFKEEKCFGGNFHKIV